MRTTTMLARDARGNYRRDLGWKLGDDGKVRQHKFYLGRDEREATVRYLKLGDCWAAVEKRWQARRATDRPLWDSVTLPIAMCVSRGDDECVLDPADHFRSSARVVNVEGVDGPVAENMVPAELVDPEALLSWFGRLQTDFGGIIPLRLAGREEAAARVRDTARTFRGMAERAERLARGPQMLHAALSAFADALRKKYLDADGRPSEYAVSCGNQIGTIRSHVENMPLDAFGLTQIEGLVDYWRNRPLVRGGRKCSVDTAKNHIKRVRAFVRWLHKSPAFDWRKHADYEVTPVRVPMTAAELADKFGPRQVDTYTVDELAVLWRYAVPRERLLMAVALNCGFGQRELGTLQTREVFLDQPHGHYPGLVGSFIKKVRVKSIVYGEWRLWPETVNGLEWYARSRAATGETALLVNDKGRPLVSRTKGNNRNGAIANAWQRLHARVARDRPDFRPLSFNKLRKTAYDLVRAASSGEVAGVFLCHGQPVRSDTLADVYGNRPFNRVFDALALVRERLAPVFATVADPFPAEAGKGNGGAASPDTVDKIVAMRREGKPYQEIARECGVSVATVTKYLRQAGMVTPYKKG
jgi:hypothetical protein